MNIDMLERHFAKNTDWVTREIAGETIVVPIRSHVGDLESIYTLNELGTEIWKFIDGKTSVGQIVESICRDYEVQPEVAQKDILDFLESIEAAGLIRGKEE